MLWSLLSSPLLLELLNAWSMLHWPFRFNGMLIIGFHDTHPFHFEQSECLGRFLLWQEYNLRVPLPCFRSSDSLFFFPFALRLRFVPFEDVSFSVCDFVDMSESRPDSAVGWNLTQMFDLCPKIFSPCLCLFFHGLRPDLKDLEKWHRFKPFSLHRTHTTWFSSPIVHVFFEAK